MAITATTLAAACGVNDTVINVTSATGITAPNNQTGTGITKLLVDQEYMDVYAVSGTSISVLRGQSGTVQRPHNILATVSIGLPGDFRKYQEYVVDESAIVESVGGFNRPAVILQGTADAIDPSFPGMYVVMTGSADAITVATPTAQNEGNVIEILSGTAYAHTVTIATAVLEVGAAKTIATFPAAIGACIAMRATNLKWVVLWDGAHGTNSAPIVYT